MARIGELDLPDRLAPYFPAWATEIATGVTCAVLGLLVRAGLDAFISGGAPFALIFPAAMLATLFGRWRAGAIAGLLSVLFAWYFLYPVQGSFAFATPGGAMAVASVAIGCLLTVLIAELFRRAVRQAAAERDQEIADRDLFLAEFDHRVKNSFALVASLIELQRRRAQNEETVAALGAALTRVESIARAHRHLYRGGTAHDRVDMPAYLAELCTALSDALFLHSAITLSCRSDKATLPRDRAVSIALVINELVTNAVKHAFAGRDAGRIEVHFRVRAEGGWELCVRDDGCGMSEEAKANGRAGGLGQRLIDAFARQAEGTLTTESGAHGTTITLLLAP